MKSCCWTRTAAVLQWAYERGCLWNEGTWRADADSGHYDVVILLRASKRLGPQ